MPIYRVIVEGRDFAFNLDDETYQLDFHRAYCLIADCEDEAGQQALESVQRDLQAQQVHPVDPSLFSKLSLAFIEQIDHQDETCYQEEFLWHFPGDAVFTHKLKQATPT